VVAGQSVGASYDVALARVDAQGALDWSFGDQGKVQIDFGGTLEQALDVTALPMARSSWLG
jgi:hypothetical protein